MLSGLKQVSAIENRPAADRSRSRDFLPWSTFEARLEGTPTRSPNKKSAGSAKPRPQYHYPDPHDCRGHHGGFSSTLIGRGVSTSPCAVGTSPTTAVRLSRGPLWGGSGRVQRRAVGLRGLVYFVGTHTRSTVPRGRSAAALGADATVAQIFVPSKGTRVGKGLTLFPRREMLSDPSMDVAGTRAAARGAPGAAR